MNASFQKNLVAVAAIGAFSGAVHAQSSVTLYGSLDAGVAYVNNAEGHSAWLQSSSVLSNTYFGLRGEEDLGGGLKTVFKIESGFNLSNGGFSNGSMFNRQAYVGLAGRGYGTLTLGRQYDSVVDYLSPLSLAGQAGGVNAAGHPLNNDNIRAADSIANAVKYESSNYGGFHFGGLYGFSNSPGQFTNGRAWSVGAGYTMGPLVVAAAYDQTDTDVNGVPNANPAATVPLAGELKRTFGLGANYTFGPATAGLLWTRTRVEQPFGIDGTHMRFDNIEANGTYKLTPALAVVGSYTFTYGKTKGGGATSSSPKWHSVTLAADYSLSRRTDLYVAGAYQHASGNVYDNGLMAVANVAAIGGGLLPASSTQNQVAAAVGIRHRF